MSLSAEFRYTEDTLLSPGMEGWPSGLRRQTQVLVDSYPRGFEPRTFHNKVGRVLPFFFSFFFAFRFFSSAGAAAFFAFLLFSPQGGSKLTVVPVLCCQLEQIEIGPLI